MRLEFWLSQVDQTQMALFGGLVYQLWGHSRRAGLEEKRGEAAWRRNGHMPEQFWKYFQCFCKDESKSTYINVVPHLVFRMSFVGEFLRFSGFFTFCPGHLRCMATRLDGTVGAPPKGEIKTHQITKHWERRALNEHEQNQHDSWTNQVLLLEW